MKRKWGFLILFNLFLAGCSGDSSSSVSSTIVNNSFESSITSVADSKESLSDVPSSDSDSSASAVENTGTIELPFI